ncbi:MAG: trypsin-like peptidase domain-containing protein [Candidatus Yonathbacteria bacterium]|nr:trypsin-like peptidase domain-containing protein [Candidatus Yonathbacteria bacterium]
MDIEELTKSQIVLLVLFVSFVTSMATGIVTVTLMDQAPTDMTYTINRFIQQTAEAVGSVVPGVEHVDTTQPTVIQEEGAIANAVAGVASSSVRIYTTATDDKTQMGDFIASGFFFPGARRVVTDAQGIERKGTYQVRTAKGDMFSAEVVTLDETYDVAILALNIPDGVTLPEPASVYIESTLRLGQTVLLLGGKTVDEIEKGIITVLPDKNTRIETDISRGTRFSGGMAFSVTGKIIGMSLVRDGVTMIIPTSVIQNMITPSSGASTGN